MKHLKDNLVDNEYYEMSPYYSGYFNRKYVVIYPIVYMSKGKCSLRKRVK